MSLETVKVKSLRHVRLFATPWTVAYQAPPSMGFSRQEYWGGLPFPSPGDLPNPGIEPHTGLQGLVSRIMVSEISQSQKFTYYMISFICNSRTGKSRETKSAVS